MKKIVALSAVLVLLSCATGPPPPQLIQPVDGITLLAHYPFMWTAVPGATTYLFEVGQDATFSSVIISRALADTVFDITDDPGLSQLQPGFVYYWQVRSGDDNNWGKPSGFRSFQILGGGKP